MATLLEKQFELDGRVTFGFGLPVAVPEDGWSPGEAPVTSQDIKHPTRDGVRFGKDLRGSATWAFKLFTNQATEAAGWDALGDVAEVWNDPEIRGESGRVAPLRYRLAGRDCILYGRPRRWSPAPNNLSLGGRIDIVADFATVDDLVYEDQLQSVPIDIAPSVDRTAGLIVPFIAPFNSTARSSVRSSSIVIGGRRPTPITLRFEGPVSGARVSVGGWTAALVDPVAANDPVTLDGRPWVTSATKQSGGGVRLSARVTRLSKMWLPPGRHDITFTGDDPTNTAKVTVSWRNALASLR